MSFVYQNEHLMKKFNKKYIIPNVYNIDKEYSLNILELKFINNMGCVKLINPKMYQNIMSEFFKKMSVVHFELKCIPDDKINVVLDTKLQ